ncbi:ABC transporter ATP-binding protein [Corynebacterium lizhenjunii]|uniref:ABC transporter ATP-binding protein n=1 Tax=Corynebacterium lizhenjunii TaxID=2709394 RepID=A0A7T0PC14_9CORY|nr:ABC transporter ATP-binding protein [Corynebacterium lizhenjunii]QPK79217.1 ABC transporter ATP-binding protein [Corynebacterium lizhenjunii]
MHTPPSQPAHPPQPAHSRPRASKPRLDPDVSSPRLHARNLDLAYEKRSICQGLNVAIPDGSFTVIIGPNACGKSTLLHGLSRLLKPQGGQVVLDGRDIQDYPAKEVARRLGLLPQSSLAPDGIRVADLVARGRYPYQNLFQQWTDADQAAVAAALDATGIGKLSGRLLDELSGGQRQRAWIAMALAQDTDILLLDEPTTYLDLTHQIELLELFTDLHLTGRTLVAVLHDLNQAARYATHLIVMRDGAIVAEGAPASIISAELVESVFHLPCRVVPDPVAGTPQVVPLGRDRSARRSPQP